MTLESKVDALFDVYIGQDKPGIVLAIIKDGSVVYKKGYGMANLEHDIQITPSTVFDIASVSKQFTGFAIAKLSFEEIISLDDDIRKHLPEVPDFGDKITVRHLVHHTSGLRDWVQSMVLAGVQMDDVISFQHILKMVKHQQALNFKPGQMYLYSNTGYNLLAEMVQRSTNQSFTDWTKSNIFNPLGMSNTYFCDNHAMVVTNRSSSYQQHEGKLYNAVNNLTALGSSSLYSTVEDLAKWILNFDHKQVGGDQVIELMHQQGILNSGEQVNYAFGQQIGAFKGLKIAEHSGSWRGFRSHLIRFLDQMFSVVILSNYASSNPSEWTKEIAELHLDNLLDSAEINQKPDQAVQTKKSVHSDTSSNLTSEQLEKFEGDYYSQELDTTYSIVAHEGQLIAQHRRNDDIQLAYDGDGFTSDEWFFSHIYFKQDNYGRVTGFRLDGERVKNLDFTRNSFQSKTESISISRRDQSVTQRPN